MAQRDGFGNDYEKVIDQLWNDARFAFITRNENPIVVSLPDLSISMKIFCGTGGMNEVRGQLELNYASKVRKTDATAFIQEILEWGNAHDPAEIQNTEDLIFRVEFALRMK